MVGVVGNEQGIAVFIKDHIRHVQTFVSNYGHCDEWILMIGIGHWYIDYNEEFCVVEGARD